jgi:CP family cyanate transporter-like MFS transporter
MVQAASPHLASPHLASPHRAGRFAAAGVVVLIAFNLRPSLSSIGPVLNEAMRDLHLSAGGAAWLTTAPVLCLGLFGPLAPALARRLGIERTVLLALAAVALGTALRGGGGFAPLLAGSLLAGAGVGMANVLMPGLLKRDFPHGLALLTGLYTMALCLGAAVAAGATAPLCLALGGDWALALAAWALPALLAMAVAALVWRRRIGPGAGAGMAGLRRVGGLLRDPLAWQVTLYMGLQSALAYSVFAWLAPVLRSRGDSPVTAGLVVSVSILAQTAASLPVPLLAARLRHQSMPAAAVMLLTVGSFLGLLWAPLAWQWALAVMLGVGMGGAFALALMLIVQRAADGHVAAALSSMAQGVGYTLAAGGPLLVGVLHDATGDWSGAAMLFAVAGGVAALAGALAGRARLVGAAALA